MHDIPEERWPPCRAAARFQVLRVHGRPPGLPLPRARRGRDAGPPGRPRRTCVRTARWIIALRVNRRPARIGYLLGIHPSTVHKGFSRSGLSRLSWQDRATGRVIRRYEHPTPGLVHVDTKKPGRLPYGGGHRVMDRARGKRHKTKAPADRVPDLRS